MKNSTSYPTKIKPCPWLGLCDDANLLAYQQTYCFKNHTECPTWKHDPRNNSEEES